MAGKTFLRLVNGKLKAIQASVTSAGAANDGDIPALDSNGRLDLSLMPVGVGPDTKVLPVSEVAGIGIGDYVNIFDDGGTESVRLADNSNGRPAHGFVKAAFADGANATVYFEGANEDLSGLVSGRVYLGTGGGVIQTPLVPVTDTGKIHQLLGVSLSATEVNTDIQDCIEL